MPTTTLDTLLLTGLSLPAKDYYKLDETSGTTAANMVSGRTNGTISGSPTMGSAGDIYGESNGGNAITFDGTNDYIDLGTSSREMAAAISTTGITLAINIKDQAAAGGANKTIIGGFNTGPVNGFQVDTYDSSAVNRLRIRMIDAAGNAYTELLAPGGSPNVEFQRANVWLFVYIKSPSTIRVYVDAQPYVGSVSTYPSGSASGTFAASAANVFLGVLAVNGSASGSYWNGIGQRFAWYAGELTEADRIAIMRTATRTDTTGKLYRVDGEWDIRSSSVWKDNGTTPATADGDAIYRFDDLTGNGDHAIQTTLANRPTLAVGGSVAGGLATTAEIDFDNKSAMDAGAQQAFVFAGTRTVFAHWSTFAVISRPIVGGYVGTFAPILLQAAGAVYPCIDPSTRKVAAARGGSVVPPSDPFPRHRAAGGLDFSAFVYGDQCANAAVYANGTYKTGAAIRTGGWATETGAMQYMGGAVGSANLMYTGRIIKAARCTVPIVESALAEWYIAEKRATGTPLIPSVHVHIAGDSVSSGQVATAGKAWQMFLPKEWTYTNSSLNGDTLANQKTRVDAGGTNWFSQSIPIRVGIIIVHNDAISSTAIGTMQTRYTNLRSSLIAAGCNKIVAVKMHSTIPGTASDLNAYYDTLIGLGLADKVVTPGAVATSDGTHPTSAGMYTLYQAIWNQALSSYYGGVRWRSGPRPIRCR